MGMSAEASCVALDASSGEMKWKQNIGGGALIAAGGYLLALNERGELIVVEASPTNYREVARAQVLGGHCLGGTGCCGWEDLLQE